MSPIYHSAVTVMTGGKLIMKKKIISVMLTAAMAVGMLTACGSSSDKGGSAGSSASSDKTSVSAQEETMTADQARKQESGRTKLVLGFDAEYPPYGYMADDGSYTGFDIELAKAVCKLEGWKLVPTPINWDSKDQTLNSGEIDCIWNGFTINGREKDYTWSEPYVNNTQVIVVSAKSDISKLSDLSGKTVGVQAASAALSVLEDSQKKLADSFAALNQFADYNVAFTELQGGSLDALAIDVGVAQYQIKKRGTSDYRILDEKLNSEQYGVGFKKGNTALAAIINDDMNKLAANGTVTKLAKKYDIADMICLDTGKSSSSKKDAK
jgi:polar amino acid transport system substrate-binding protein